MQYHVVVLQQDASDGSWLWVHYFTFDSESLAHACVKRLKAEGKEARYTPTVNIM
jgi:hypothetical protein